MLFGHSAPASKIMIIYYLWLNQVKNKQIASMTDYTMKLEQIILINAEIL